ncbi:MAG: DUF3429 domain-containing protein [Ideonella sp.]
MDSGERVVPSGMTQVQPGKRVRQLAYAGLLPFLIGAALIWIVRADAQSHAAAALSAYAAVILSFLGGIHWGFGIRSGNGGPANFGWAVVPSLVAWVAVLMPPNAALVIHGLMLVVCYLVDRKVYPRQAAAAWLTLRFRLTVVASLSCFLAAAAA